MKPGRRLFHVIPNIAGRRCEGQQRGKDGNCDQPARGDFHGDGPSPIGDEAGRGISEQDRKSVV